MCHLQTLNNSKSIFQSMLLVALNSNKIFYATKCELLFSTLRNGSSFNNFVNSIKGYSAPVVILITNKYSSIK